MTFWVLGCGVTSFHGGAQFATERKSSASEDAQKNSGPDENNNNSGTDAGGGEGSGQTKESNDGRESEKDGSDSASKEDDAESGVAGVDANADSGDAPLDNKDDNKPSENQEKEDPQTPEEVVDLCKKSTPQRLQQQLVFDERIDCNFSSAENADDALTAGNLHRLNGHLMARETTSQAIDLPQNAIICGISLASENSNFRYDDFLTISLNQYALMISNDLLMQCDEGADPATCLMKDEFDVWTWDFDRIKGRPFGFNGERYCFGYQEGAENSGECEFPGHDQAGAVKFSLGTDAVSKLSVKLKDQANFTLSLTATGDNDNEDCWHKALSLDVGVDYVVK